jgi:NitT/TauT family transport system ATP-binding protein
LERDLEEQMVGSPVRDEAAQVRERRSTAQCHVLIGEVTKTYQLKGDAIEAIHSISFQIERSGFVSILGPSGCGKSTLLMMLAGIEGVTSGTIAINGTPVAGPRRETSVVFQTPTLFPWRTVRANVLFPIEVFRGDRQRAHEEASKLLETTGLTGFENRLPEQLSGGMVQRVSLCRALITDPELLLMDEPFSALDALTRDDLGLELQRVWERYRKTVVFVTHSIREAVFLSDRVIVLSPRPAVIARDLAIDLPRPRSLEIQETAKFNRYCADLRAALGR